MFKGSIGILMVVVLVASVFVPIEIPYSFNTTAKVYPVQQWVLHKNLDGNLVKTLHNYKTGLLSEYGTFQFDRGDVVNIKFMPNMTSESRVDSGTLIANITSINLAQRLVNLENELNIEKANLLKFSTGAKMEIVVHTQEELNQAKQNLEFRRQNYERAKKMWEDGLIAKSKLEIAETAFKQANIDIELSKKKIGVNTTGEKPEEINLINTRIASLENEIAFLKTTTESMDIHTPISGNISFEVGPQGDKLIIEDVTEHILLIPIKLKDRDFIGPDTKIELDIMGSDTLVQAQIIEVNDRVEILNRNVVVLAKASVSGDIPGLATGMPVKCIITTGMVLPKEYMKRAIKLDSK